MSLPGMTGMLVGASQPAALLYTLGVGSSTIPLGKDFSITAYGYASLDPTYGAFGSISPTTWLGNPLCSIYQVDSALTTIFEVFGDVHTLLPAMTIDGAAQHLGTGSFSSTSSHTATVTIASPGVFTWNSHGMANGTQVLFKTTGALPTGLAVDTVYYVVNRAANTFQVSATSGGSAINTTGSQSGTHTAYNRPVTAWSSTSSTANPFVPASVTVAITS